LPPTTEPPDEYDDLAEAWAHFKRALADRAVGVLIAAIYRAAMALDRIRYPGGAR
jgi:hypothetical protein